MLLGVYFRGLAFSFCAEEPSACRGLGSVEADFLNRNLSHEFSLLRLAHVDWLTFSLSQRFSACRTSPCGSGWFNESELILRVCSLECTFAG
jgi:hypothetical protein